MGASTGARATKGTPETWEALLELVDWTPLAALRRSLALAVTVRGETLLAALTGQGAPCWKALAVSWAAGALELAAVVLVAQAQEAQEVVELALAAQGQAVHLCAQWCQT